MAQLLLGPLLRHVGGTDATVWVEADRPCWVEVLGHRERTFHVDGHHYAIVPVRGLQPGTTTEYEVVLDGSLAWPTQEAWFPRSVIRTMQEDGEQQLLFGSCRVAAPHEAPFALSPDEHRLGHGPDVLHALALRMRAQPPEEWPHAIVFVGDQVYADEVSPQTLAFIDARRGTSRPPGAEVADFEEYTRLYRESWGEPSLRWFLSTVASAMLWDDHDVHDDWNISHVWVERMRRKPWWRERIVGAVVSYWIYQHLGNLSPSELERDDLLARVRAVDDAAPLLRDFAVEAQARPAGKRWSFCRDFGKTRLVAIDCRAGRVLDEGRRSMLDEDEWQWIEERVSGDFDHLLLGMSDPYLLAEGIHYLQAWNQAICDGAWGRRPASLGERLREAADLDHWASFPRAFDRLTELVRSVAAGERGQAPASIVALSGDVHNAYVVEAAFRQARVKSKVYQAVCSPLRNPLRRHERLGVRLLSSRGAALIGRALAASAGAASPPLRWRYLHGPTFDNQIATVSLRGRKATLALDRALEGGHGPPRLERLFAHDLT